MAFIEVENLNKQFIIRKKREKGQLMRPKEEISALREVSFQVNQGELVGYIGPNGAGKSTTVKILSGILTPDSGRASVDGLVPWADRKAHVRRIGVVFGQRSQLWWDVPIADSFALLKEIYHVPEAAYQARMGELTEALQLGDLMRTPLRLLSLGQRMRAELCGSLLHSPSLLFLDEPTIGLDAVSKLTLREFLQWENRQRGTTILLTTHDMEDITALCSRVMVLVHGRKLYDGELTELLARYDTERIITARYEEEISGTAWPEGCQVRRNGENWIITYAPEKIPTAEMMARMQQAGHLRECTVQPQNVDRLIARMYQEMEL